LNVPDKRYENLNSELMNRIEKNHEEYYDSLLGLGNEELIDMVDMIKARNDAYTYMTNHYVFSDVEVEFFLKLQNPLEVVAEYWMERNYDITDLDFIIYDIVDKEDALAIYPLADDITTHDVHATASEKLPDSENLKVPKATVIKGEVACFDLVISTGDSDYPFLVGEVNAVDKLGSPDHHTGNPNDDVFVDFRVEEYSAERIKEIEEHFSKLYGEPKRFDDLPLDSVVMSPDSLIRIQESDLEMFLQSREAVETHCNQVLDFMQTKKNELLERIEKNYSDYQNSLLSLDKQELLDMTGKIKAVSDAYSYMTDWHDYDEHELEYLLEFQNPLEVLADEWHRRHNSLSDVSYAMEDIYMRSDELLEQYPVISDIDISKYDIPNGKGTLMPKQAKPHKKSIEDRIKEGASKVKEKQGESAPTNKKSKKETKQHE